MPDAEELMDEAYECLEAGELERAFEIAEELIRMRYSGGFEIAALAHLEEDETEEAIRILEKGVREAPEVWLLWQLLGNCYSDVQDYEKAMEAYQQALTCEGVDPNSVHLNIAIALSRLGQFERSLFQLSLVSGKHTESRAQAIRLGNYADLKRWADILTEAPRVVTALEDDEEVDPADLGRIHARYGQALLRTGQTEEALQACRRALLFDRHNVIALAVVRECNNQQCARQDQYFKLMVEGQWFEPFEGDSPDALPGFFATYWVLAESAHQALEFAQQIELDEVSETLEIEEWKIEDDWPDAATLRGVYRRSGYVFFGDAEDEEDEED